MGAGCLRQKNQKKNGEPTSGNPELIKKTNTPPNSIQDEKEILSLRNRQDTLMQEIKKIQRNIDVYKEQIKQKIDTNRTMAKILMAKKENQQKALINKKNMLKAVNNKIAQYVNFKGGQILVNIFDKVDNEMLKNDHDNKIQETRQNAYELAARQKLNNLNIEEIANLDKDPGYDSDESRQTYLERAREVSLTMIKISHSNYYYIFSSLLFYCLPPFQVHFAESIIHQDCSRIFIQEL